MSVEIILVIVAAAVALIIFAISPLARAICWDALVHPRHHCHWQKEGDRLREVKMP